MNMLAENAKIVLGFKTQTGGAIEGDWICLKNYEKACLIVNIINGADNTATVIAVDKAIGDAGSASDSITLNNFWTLESIATAPLADAFTKGTAAALVSVGASQQSVSHMVIIEIDPAELITTTVNYDWVQATVTSSNAAHYISAIWILYNPRYAMDQASQLTVISG